LLGIEQRHPDLFIAVHYLDHAFHEDIVALTHRVLAQLFEQILGVLPCQVGDVGLGAVTTFAVAVIADGRDFASGIQKSNFQFRIGLRLLESGHQIDIGRRPCLGWLREGGLGRDTNGQGGKQRRKQAK
jgi:hypothetical protein